ncbi:unnamed protein product [Pleuronectes platessa]|uniref:Uncharacterized protein n=1 Tax=Pleuronectes platessa TaxID=8262 RepID=A0A9N7ZA15_PLEPL|nr:unnamed protein product [Pleuronectes platessa]
MYRPNIGSRSTGGSVCSTPLRFFWGGGGPRPRRLMASLVWELSFSWAAGWCSSPVRNAGTGWRGATLDACRSLLAEHLSYRARWGNPLFTRGPLRRFLIK